MLVVLPVCAKDEHLALLNLALCKHFEPSVPFEVLISHEQGYDPQKVVAACRGYFSKVVVGQYPRLQGNPRWPALQNWAWQQAARAVQSAYHEPWLWWEQDAVPLRARWLESIRDAHVEGGKSFSGCIVKRKDFPTVYMAGVAVYPWNTWSLAPTALTTLTVPFDIVLATQDGIMGRVKDVSGVIHHEFKPTGGGWTVGDIIPVAALYHRCETGELQQHLLAAGGTKQNKNGPCVICLGRYGDIINALPIAHALAKQKRRPVPFFVAREFASVLDGVSYVTPWVLDLDYSKMPEATAIAARQFKKVVRGQVYGTPEGTPACGMAHNRLAWKLAGMLERWDDPTHIPVFDKRDRRREAALVQSMVKSDPRPILLINLAGGHSGPFPDHHRFQQRLHEEFASRFQIVDLSSFRATRLFDLLGLFEVAVGLLTIDTATVHLAATCPRLPVLMLRPDLPYHAADPRCNCKIIIPYPQWQARWGEVRTWVEQRLAPSEILLTYETHKGTSARALRAQTSWQMLVSGCGWKLLPFPEPYPRDSRALGDRRGVPYINDILKRALECVKSDDSIVILINDDIILLPAIHKELTSRLNIVPALSCSRRNIQSFRDAETQERLYTHNHLGRDLFAFRAWWLRQWLPELPDLLIGTNDWDNVVINLIRRTCGVLIEGVWTSESAAAMPYCELASPNVLHEAHLSYVDRPENNGGNHNLWNRLQLHQWSKKYLPTVKFLWTDEVQRKWSNKEIKFKPCKEK